MENQLQQGSKLLLATKFLLLEVRTDQMQASAESKLILNQMQDVCKTIGNHLSLLIAAIPQRAAIKGSTLTELTKSVKENDALLAEKDFVECEKVTVMESERKEWFENFAVVKSEVKKKGEATLKVDDTVLVQNPSDKSSDLVASESTKDVTKRFECRRCSEMFKLNNDCLRHEVSAHGMKAHQCSYCESWFRKRSGLVRHARRHRTEHPQDQGLQCVFCEVSFDSTQECVEHMKTHPDDRPFKCRYCKQHFGKRGTREKHEERAHLAAAAGSGGINCKYCDELIASADLFPAHLNTHPRERPYKCRSCDHHFKYPATRREHEGTRHTQQEPFTCSDCGRRYTVESSFREHIKLHKTGKQHTCNKCGLKFAKTSGLQAHLVRHGDKTHLCTLCDQSFFLRSQLKDHMRLHSGETPYQCRHCDKRFPSCERRYSHEVSAHKPKNFSCGECGQRFYYRSLLRKHENRHRGLKQFPCTYCGRSFGSRYGQVLHERNKHTGEKPYVCQFCGADFTSNAACKIHERVHTGEKPYPCSFCPMQFNQVSARKLHELRHKVRENSSTPSPPTAPSTPPEIAASTAAVADFVPQTSQLFSTSFASTLVPPAFPAAEATETMQLLPDNLIIQTSPAVSNVTLQHETQPGLRQMDAKLIYELAMLSGSQ